MANNLTFDKKYCYFVLYLLFIPYARESTAFYQERLWFLGIDIIATQGKLLRKTGFLLQYFQKETKKPKNRCCNLWRYHAK